MKRRGRGIACMWYPIGFTVAANPSAAVVKINEDGTATLLTGTVETGQGSLTILAQIVAQELGIATEDVHVVSADTDATPMDTGAIASRTTYVTGNAARLAAEKAKLMLFDVAAPMLGVKANQLDARDHHIVVQGYPQRKGAHRRRRQSAPASSPANRRSAAATSIPPPSRSTRKRGRASRSRPTSMRRRSPRWTSTTRPERSKCSASLPRTTAVPAINPMLVEGQVEGGISMGVGFALQEGDLFDAKAGSSIRT
jgi:CO/xanthine dehydrogenase Mo-binding subunit